jgi:hypothetical protein
MATRAATRAVHEKIVAYVLRHPELTYQQISDRIGIPLNRLSTIMLKAGYRRDPERIHAAVTSTINLDELEN